MGQMSDYLRNKIIDHAFRSATFSKPTHMYVGLFTVAPSAAGGGTEVSGGSYARVDLAPGDTNWTNTQGTTSGNSSGVTGHTDNALAITFPAPTANWGTVTNYAVFDASTNGNMWFWGTLVIPKAINNGDGATSFAVGDLDFTIS